MQITKLHPKSAKLQKVFGHPKLSSIYGAGYIKNPKLLLLFMNPTAKNISAEPGWQGIRAPWLGTKNAWKLFYKLGFIDKDNFKLTQELERDDWTVDFSLSIYKKIKKSKVYITNLAKCTQEDARALGNQIFKEYLDLTLWEIYQINPRSIVTFGNQVSSILLNKPIKVSSYDDGFEEIIIKDRTYRVFPTYYPVGQGMRNMDKAIQRIKRIN